MSDVINRGSCPPPCEAKLPVNVGTPGNDTIWQQICDQVGTETWRYSCVHEHVIEGRTCPAHRPEPFTVGCKTCWDLGHECPMLAEPVAALVVCGWCERPVPADSVRPCCGRPGHPPVCIDADDCLAAIRAVTAALDAAEL